MAMLPQKPLFCWDEIENLGDLERLVLVLRTMPDERLMAVLERERGRGRDDYPVRAVWNSLVAGVVFQHVSVAGLRRELLRNAQLRQVCGFDVLVAAEKAVPPAWVYTRFFRLLFRHAAEVDTMFDELVAALHRELPGFGRVLAGDGKAIPTHARPRKKGGDRPAARWHGAEDTARTRRFRRGLRRTRRRILPVPPDGRHWPAIRTRGAERTSRGHPPSA
jgi:hypothetical protein